MKRAASGIWYRPSDKFIVNEAESCYGQIPVRPDDVLLDLGAHIGTTSHLILGKGAKASIAVEADPTNIPLLRRNLARRKATVLWSAVGAVAGRVPFYPYAAQTFKGSLLPDPARRPVQVPMIPFGGLLTTYRPTIVKCDIEFGEYDLPELWMLPDHVRVLAMEVHIRYSATFQERAQTSEELREQREEAAWLIRSIEQQGFREIRRRNKQARAGTSPKALEDDTGLPEMTKAVDAVWER